MSRQTWTELLAVQKAAGTLFTGYTTAKTVINPQALAVLPAGYMEVGRAVRTTVAGGISNIVTTPGTITFQQMIGANIAWTSGAIQLNATAHTTLPFWLEILLTAQVEGNGTTAKAVGMGRLGGIMFTLTAAQVDAPNTPGLFMVPATAPAQGAGYDSTIANVLDFFAGFSISNAGNGIQIAEYAVEALN